jgi:hypothetical protein
MPNLNYDPHAPVTDLLGFPIAEGDYVAWGTNWGRSAALCVAKIDRIRFYREKPGSYGRTEDCEQHEAEGYQLLLEPVHSTGDVTWVYEDDPKESVPWSDNIDHERHEWGRKPRTASRRAVRGKVKRIQHVKNVVKLDPATVEDFIRREEGRR